MSDEPTLDEIHGMLSAERRRHVLSALYNHGPMWKSELEKYVASAENQKIIDELEDDELQRVKTTLHQDHLPPLDEHKFVIWDKKSNAVALGPHCHLVLRHLDGIELDDGPQWLTDRLEPVLESKI